MEFAELEESTLECIKKKRNITFLWFKSALKSLFKNNEEMIAEVTRDAFSIDIMWKRMSKYWNFINPTLFQQTIYSHFGNETLRSTLKQYLEKLMKFQRKTHFHEFIKCYNTQLSDRQYDELAIQLKHHELYLEDVDKIAEKLAEKFVLPKFAFQLKDGSSNTIVWAIPVKMAASLKDSIVDMSMVELDHLQIRVIRISGK